MFRYREALQLRNGVK
ncbi:unnamed protein product, partial [Didymodactylos carnosus]